MNLQYLIVDKPKPELNLVVNSIKTTSIGSDVRVKLYGSGNSDHTVANTAAPLPIYVDYIPGPPEIKSDVLVPGDVYTYKFTGVYKTNGAGQTILFQTTLGSTAPIPMPDSGGVIREISITADFYVQEVGESGKVEGRYTIHFGQAVGSITHLQHSTAFPDTTVSLDLQMYVYFGVASPDNLIVTRGASLVG